MNNKKNKSPFKFVLNINNKNTHWIKTKADLLNTISEILKSEPAATITIKNYIN